MADGPLTAPSIPPGLGPGDTPAGLSWPRSLWIILPAKPSPAQSESIRRLRIKLSEQDEIRVSEVRVRSTKGPRGFTYPLIPANEVMGLYRQAHRARTAVIAFGGTQVLLDISELPTAKGCVALERFVKYKCSYALVSRPEELEGAWTKALAWMNDIHCEGQRDPRCYPMAIFETDREYPLGTPEERQDFINLHKASKRSRDLTDARHRSWKFGPDHTLDLIQVAGHTLPIGFHWDVQAARSSTITTGWEVWHLPRGGYTNVHPDALVRGGNATKTHPASSSTGKSKSLRTPRSSRSRGRR